ncbi:hypothetical protein Hanom_Chr16g01502651 [Helianthus anomalus]
MEILQGSKKSQLQTYGFQDFIVRYNIWPARLFNINAGFFFNSEPEWPTWNVLNLNNS